MEVELDDATINLLQESSRTRSLRESCEFHFYLITFILFYFVLKRQPTHNYRILVWPGPSRSLWSAFAFIPSAKVAAVEPGRLGPRCQYLLGNPSRGIVIYQKLTPQMAFDKCDKLKLDHADSKCLHGRH